MNWDVNCAKLPNRLLKDIQINCSVRQVGAVLYSCHINGEVTKSMKEIAKLAGICSVTTVETAIGRLIDTGYIVDVIPNHRYSEKHGRYIKDSNSYRLDMSFSQGFTLVPRALFRICYGEYSSFVVAAGIRCMMGNVKRGWPSLNKISKALGIAVSTVCRAIKYLVNSKVLYREPCKKRNRAFTENSYFPLQTSARRCNNTGIHGASISDTTVCAGSENSLSMTEKRTSETLFISPHVSIINRFAKKINTFLRWGVLSNLVYKGLRLRKREY
jgi:hypothetical protein